MDGGFFLLSWLIVSILAAVAVAKVLWKVSTRYDKPSIPVWRLQKSIKVKRGRDHGVEVPWHQVDQRHRSGRRHTDRPRKLP